MAVSSTTGGLRTGVCLSTDRPQNPYNGQVVYETDTNRTLVWDNSAWVVVADPALVSFSGTGATVTADAMTVAGENVTPYTGRRNLFYNGAMQVAQRGTSVSSQYVSGYYTVDRWQWFSNATGARWDMSQDSDAPDGFRNSWKITCSQSLATPAAGDYMQVSQRLEGFDVQHLAKGTSSSKELTLSFWVKSNVTGTYIARLFDDQNSRATHRAYTVSSSDTWEYKTLTFDADTVSAVDNDNTEGLRLTFWLASGTNYNSGTLATSWAAYSGANSAVGNVNLASAVNNYWQITGVQLEVGDKATPFEHRSYGEELALCQRYYYKPTATGGISYLSHIYAGTQYRLTVPYHVEMRANPTVTYSGISGGSSVTSVTPNTQSVNFYSSAGWFYIDINTTVEVSAEL